MFANPRKTTAIRRLGQVDIAPLREAVLAIPEAVWAAEDAGSPRAATVRRRWLRRRVSNPRPGG